MKQLFCLATPLLALLLLCACNRLPTGNNFSFTGHRAGYRQVTPATKYSQSSPFGYDLGTVQGNGKPFFFSVDLPEGNHRVTVTLGSNEADSRTTVKAESRRLMLENIAVPKGQTTRHTFVVNIRNTQIDETTTVNIKPREIGKLIWDNKLTLEFNGSNPAVASLEIEEAPTLPTLFLAGNSTVVDEADEPWCGWGQMFTRFFTPDVAVANYAESGLAANTFVSSGRLAKLLSQMKAGDYLFIEFGHNDQKQKGEGKCPYTSYKADLKHLVQAARSKQATPILVTPMHRRAFNAEGKVINTHGDYPDAVRQLAREEGVHLIDLTAMSATLYEAWGTEGSKRAFVHYPAGTFPGQDQPLQDNTHFNPYGAYQIAKCILKGIVQADVPLSRHISPDFQDFDPALPDDVEAFSLPPTPFSSVLKPDGN